MNTTNLFVELIVIGMFACLWLAIPFIAVFGAPILQLSLELSVFAALPIFSVIYVLGIITDRLADVLFERLFLDRLRVSILLKDSQDSNTSDNQTSSSKEAKYLYQDLKYRILRGPDRIADLGDYARSRARICRGVAFNGALTIFFGGLWLILPNELGLSTDGRWVIFLILTGVVLGAWYSWRRITVAGLKQMKYQSQLEV